jgi:hypothetical protein
MFPDLPAGTKLIPVLDDAKHAAREKEIREIMHAPV